MNRDVPILINGIDNRICRLLIDYMTSPDGRWTEPFFQTAQYSYIKDDLATIQRPAVFVYPLTSHKKTFSGKYYGEIIMEISIRLRVQRAQTIEAFLNIANFVQLMNINGDFNTYLGQNLYGLFWFGQEMSTDYREVFHEISKVKIKFNFMSDLMRYKQQLEQDGYDVWSPDDKIYNEANYLQEQVKVLNREDEVAFTI